MTTILFLHRWHSVPGWRQTHRRKGHSHEAIDPTLDDNDSIHEVKIAQAGFGQHQPQIIAGNSRGAAVAMNITSGDGKWTPDGLPVDL